MFTSTLFGLKQAEVRIQSKVHNLQHDSRPSIPKEFSDKLIWSTLLRNILTLSAYN